LSNRRRAPDFAEQGEPGQEQWLRLELRLMADVALVGFPNVGKSTLISRISAARPRIANYPFTTLEPQLGVVRLDDGAEFVVADIPGLIEGASEGRGLGHRFLRHIERTRVLVLLIDISDDGTQPPPLTQLEVLDAELAAYDPDLALRPRLVVATKSDVAPGVPPDLPVDAVISSVTGQGVSALVGQLATLVAGARDLEAVPESYVVHRPVAEGVRIEREPDGSYRVVGRAAERAVALNDLTNPSALDEVWSRLRRLGVHRALVRAGADSGDTVIIGELSFTYEPDG
jgi:GTP-binding protein